MAKDKQAPSDLVVAAEALDEELARAEVMSRAVRRIRLDSDKNIQRAAEQLGQVLALPERLGGRLNALSVAMARLQERQQAALEPLATFATELHHRRQLLGKHMQSFAELGAAAGQLGAALAEAAGDGAALAEVDRRLEGLVEGARTLSATAQNDGFPEIAREADVLKQRLAAVRRRLPPAGSA